MISFSSGSHLFGRMETAGVSAGVGQDGFIRDPRADRLAHSVVDFENHTLRPVFSIFFFILMSDYGECFQDVDNCIARPWEARSEQRDIPGYLVRGLQPVT